MGLIRSSMDPPCPFSVEVTVSEDRSLASAATSSTVKSQISVGGGGTVHNRNRDDEDEPALVPVGTGGGSDSDSSSQDEDDGESVENDDDVDRAASSSKGSSSKPMHMQSTTNDTVGMIDCLSDQFSHMFCSSSDNLNDGGYNCNGDTSIMNHRFSLAGACAVPESDASDVFASLNFWLSPSDEEKLSDTQGKQPRNRISARGHKTSYVQQVYNHWHPDNTVQLERSKSMTKSSDSNLTSTTDLQFDVFYDSDPESEHSERKCRERSLLEPANVSQRRRSFRSRRPSAIETIYEEELQTCRSSSNNETAAAPSAPRNAPRFSLKLGTGQQSPESAGTTTTTLLPPPGGSPTSLNDHHLLHLQHDEFLRQYVQVRCAFLVG